MTWKQEPPKFIKLIRLKVLFNRLAELEILRVRQTADRMQQVVTMAKGNK